MKENPFLSVEYSVDCLLYKTEVSVSVSVNRSSKCRGHVSHVTLDSFI